MELRKGIHDDVKPLHLFGVSFCVKSKRVRFWLSRTHSRYYCFGNSYRLL